MKLQQLQAEAMKEFDLNFDIGTRDKYNPLKHFTLHTRNECQKSFIQSLIAKAYEAGKKNQIFYIDVMETNHLEEGTEWGIVLGNPNPIEDFYIDIGDEKKAFEIRDKIRNFMSAI